VTDGVAEDDGAGAAADCGRIEALDGVGVGADGVFGYIHRREIVVDGELDGFFGGALEVIDGPVFHQATDGAGAEEGGGFDGDSYALGNLGDGADVGLDRAGGSVGANLHAIAGDFPGQGFGVFCGAGAGAGQADVERVDA